MEGRSARVSVPAGPLGALVTFEGLDTLDETGLDGDDRYVVHLWPGVVEACVRVLQDYAAPFKGAAP